VISFPFNVMSSTALKVTGASNHPVEDAIDVSGEVRFLPAVFISVYD